MTHAQALADMQKAMTSLSQLQDIFAKVAVNTDTMHINTGTFVSPYMYGHPLICDVSVYFYGEGLDLYDHSHNNTDGMGGNTYLGLFSWAKEQIQEYIATHYAHNEEVRRSCGIDEITF